jgi:hypothetical protein
MANNTYIAIANEVGDTFSDSIENDLIVFAAQPSRILMGTQSNVNAKISVNSNVIKFQEAVNFSRSSEFNALSTFKDEMMSWSNTRFMGVATFSNDVIVYGRLLTGSGMTLDGDVKVTGGATYCNGDINFINDWNNTPSNQNILISSVYGIPNIKIIQKSNVSSVPLTLYQDKDNIGYITNSNNLFISSSSNVRILVSSNISMTLSNNNNIVIKGFTQFTSNVDVYGKIYSATQFLASSNTDIPGYAFVNDSNTGLFHPSNHNISIVTNSMEAFRITDAGFVGIGMSNPKTKLDVFGGDVNANNVITTSKSSTASNLNIVINWDVHTTNSAFNIMFDTYQQVTSSSEYGIRKQKHVINMANTSNMIQHMAIANGNVSLYTGLFVNCLQSTSNSITIESLASNIAPIGLHNFKMNVVLYPPDIGHVWLS